MIHEKSRVARIFSVVLAIVLIATGCSTTAPPQPYKLNGYWGGVMNYAGSDYFVFALDLNTSSEGVVSGYGVFTGDPTGATGAWVNVTGSTQPASVNLTLRDNANDTIQLSGSVEGAVIRGTWTYPSGPISGSYRMTAEENVHLLNGQLYGAASHKQSLASLFDD